MKTDIFLRERYNICFVLLLLFVVPSLAQRISISPRVDSLYIVGSCTLPQMNCELKESSIGIDTIVISARYGAPLCTGFPPIQTNIIPTFYYIVRDSLNQFHYELWLRPTSYDTTRRLGFDTIYAPSPQLYILVLKVFVSNNVVDSSKVKLCSITTGLFVEGNSNPSFCQAALNQNYPNPFNPTTNISFSIPSRSYVSLKVFDMCGKEVSTLASGLLPAGNHSFQWNADALPSGVYFYRIQAGNFIQTKKLCLLK
jgi:hypothetical protein